MIDVIGICKKAKQASYDLAGYSKEQKNDMLLAIARELKVPDNIVLVKSCNVLDISLATKNGKDATFVDRLTINDSRIENMVEGLLQVVQLDDPNGELVDSWTLENGLEIKKVRSSLGVVGIIYEARPNVTIDATALCLKSGNAVILRGSKDAINTNRALYQIMVKALRDKSYNSDIIGFVDDISRDATKVMLDQEKTIDVVIPRGGEGLKHFVLEHAKMPVIASAGGNCHIYVEGSADQDMAIKILINAKVQRPSVCNACEHLIVDSTIAKEFLPKALQAMKDNDVEVVADSRACEILDNVRLATFTDFDTEFLTYKITFAVVDTTAEAIKMINTYSTKHSESIITSSQNKKDMFIKFVDSAVVYTNASTRFTDGFEFGLGAEMGISTQKLHARGPLALKELTSVKYVVNGQGQVRK